MTATDAEEESTKKYGDISVTPNEIRNIHQDGNDCPDTTTVPNQQNTPTSQQHLTPTSTQHSTTEESNRNTETYKVSHNLAAAVSPTDSPTSNREHLAVEANTLNLSGPVFTKLIMELHTYN